MYLKDNEAFSDNLVAIEMLKDITVILSAIEHNDCRNIKSGLRNLKEHISEFEEIFYINKADKCY